LVLARTGVATGGETPTSSPNVAAAPSAAGECGPVCDAGCCPHGGWYAGLEGTFLQVSRDPSAIFLRPGLVEIPDPNLGSSDFNSAYGVGARGWLGYQNCEGWGLRARFWDFRDTQNVSTFDSDFLFANGTSALRAYTIDMEVTKDFQADCWSFEGAFGGRSARLEQDQTLVATSNFNTESAFASRYISGTGITGFFESRRALGDSNWSLFANVRGSVLWGSDYGAVGGTINVDRLSVQNATGNTLSILETQVGAEWSHPLECLRGTFFARGAYEYQLWSAADNLNVILNSGTGFHAAPESANVAFNGLVFAFGFRR
jgi:Legionella pneumophila major outer membrane protein precursor